MTKLMIAVIGCAVLISCGQPVDDDYVSTETACEDFLAWLTECPYHNVDFDDTDMADCVQDINAGFSDDVRDFNCWFECAEGTDWSCWDWLDCAKTLC